MIERILLILDRSISIDSSLTLVDKLVGPGSSLTALNIIDSSWKNILGDEWISNKTTQNNFFHYMENNYYREALHLNDTFIKWTKGNEIALNTLIKTGVPQKLVIETFTEDGPFDLVLLPTGAIKFEAVTLAKKLGCPIMVNPI